MHLDRYQQKQIAELMFIWFITQTSARWGTANMINAHRRRVEKLSQQLKSRTEKTPLSLKKKTVSHMVPHPANRKHDDDKLDISDFDEILEIDTNNRLCTAEPGVTFEKLVRATLPHNLVPAVVSEFRTITIGGAVAGCSIESMSYKLGGFHDSCVAYEVVTAKGEVLDCRPDNEHGLPFR